jgi:hypothetical protein
MSIFVRAFFLPLNDFKVNCSFQCDNNTKPLSNNIEIRVQNNKSQKWISKVCKKKKNGINIPVHGRQKDIAFPIFSLTNFATSKKLTISTSLEIL